ncbi:MAG: zf-TFIIB domain-containing protein [Chloroflexi bacterium]|nr:zf-TFIIB domain-containing protein [Chloroflexota bacterium]
MKCPVCKIDMIVVEYKKIELDYCTKCFGVWFDSGELELMLHGLLGEKAFLSQLLTGHKVESGEKKRKCPICGKKMDKAIACKEPQVLIDACPRGEGLWFDGGEVEQLVKQACAASGEAEQDAISFLADALHASVDSPRINTRNTSS